MFWQPTDWLGIDAVYTGSTARWVDNADGRYVEGAVEHAGQFGVSATRDQWEASMRVRYLGPYAMVADNSQRASGQVGVNLRGAYNFRRMQFYAELINAFDDDNKDIVYWYEAYVAGFDPPGITSEDIDCGVTDCRVSRAREPRTLRFGIKYRF